jgi:cell division protein FtsB
MDLQILLKSKAVTVLLLAIFGTVGFVTVELYIQKKQVDSEVRRLQSQAQTLTHDNQQLSELIKYLDTPEYKEREAREKLNLKKAGEEVVVLPSESELNAQVAGSATDSRSNPSKWFSYFFNKE